LFLFQQQTHCIRSSFGVTQGSGPGDSILHLELALHLNINMLPQSKHTATVHCFLTLIIFLDNVARFFSFFTKQSCEYHAFGRGDASVMIAELRKQKKEYVNFFQG